MSRRLFDSAVFWVGMGAAVIALGGIGIAVGAVNLAPHAGVRDPWFILGVVFASLGALALAWALVLFVAHQHLDRHLAANPAVVAERRPQGKSVEQRVSSSAQKATAADSEVPWRDDPSEVADGLAALRIAVDTLNKERQLERPSGSPLKLPMYDANTKALYLLRHGNDALALFDRAVDLGVVTKSERAKVEAPLSLDLLISLFATLEKRLRGQAKP